MHSYAHQSFRLHNINWKETSLTVDGVEGSPLRDVSACDGTMDKCRALKEKCPDENIWARGMAHNEPCAN